MRRGLLVLALLVIAAPGWATPFDDVPEANRFAIAPATYSLPASETGTALASKLAPSILRGSADVPEHWLAQRTIDREWGLSDDSLYRTVDIAAWKSEGMAMGMSAVVPGTGQLYVGESSGWLFMLAEGVLWAGRVVTRQEGVKLRGDAAAFVGDPTDSTSTWSFARYTSSTGNSADQLQKLWFGDRDSYYQALADDAGFSAGFAGADPGATYESYRGIRHDSQDRFKESRMLEMATVLNHVYAAFDAFRAAHFHNLPLRRTYQLQLGGRLRHGEPQLRAALARSF